MSSDVQICTFYLKNACDRGKSCTFSHQTPISGQKSSEPAVCRYFLQGNCAYGNKCQRSHDAKVRPKFATSDSKKKGRSKLGANTHEVQPDAEQGSNHSEVASDCEREEVPSPRRGGSGDPQPIEETLEAAFEQSAEKLKSPCMFYSQGLCQSGKDCEFSHSDPFGIGTSSGQSSSRGQERSSKRQKDSEPRKVCKHFQRGSCHLGKDCRFEHVPSGQSPSNLKASNPDQPPSPLPSMERRFSDSASVGLDAGVEDAVEHDESHANLEEEEDTDYVNRYERRDNPSERNEFEGLESKKGSWSDRPLSDSYSEENQVDEVEDRQQVTNESPPQTSQQGPKFKGPGSYYGEGWEERELESPAPLPPQSKHPQPTQEDINPPTKIMYPHVSEVQPHWSQFADPLANSEIPFCKPHAQGQCMQGESCRFRHSLTPEEYTLLFRDQQPNLWTLERNPNGTAYPAAQPVRQIAEQRAPLLPRKQIQHDVPQTQPSASRRPAAPPLAPICFFYTSGKCRNGESCPYRHDGPPEAPDTAPMSSEQDNWGPRPSKHADFNQVKSNQPPCKFFASQGFCRNDPCRFRHGDVVPDGNPDYPSSRASGPQSSTGPPANEENDKENDVDNEWAPWPKDGDPTAADINAWAAPVDYSGWDSPAESTAQSSRPKQPCRQFAQGGQCRWGEACKFAHDAGPEPTEEASQNDLKINSERVQESEQWPLIDNSSPSAPGASPPPQQVELIADEENDSWTQSWPAGGENSEANQTKIKVPCKDFGQGYCKFGDDCRYQHVAKTESEKNEEEISPSMASPVDEETHSLQDNHIDASASSSSANDPPVLEEEEMPDQESEAGPEPDLDAIVFDHPHVKRGMMNCEVTFGRDSTPDKVTTASDTTKLLLSELPVHVGPREIEGLAGPYGQIEETIAVDDTAHSATIRVEFAEVSQAVNAFKHLNGRTFESRTIVASLDARTPLTTRSPDQKLVLKIAWPNPCVVAWSHYATISKAKSEAARLNDIIVRGRNIKVNFVTPLRNQKDSFAIKIDRLPHDVTKAEIEGLCQDNTLITMNRPTYPEDPSPIEAIRSSLSEFGGLESFDILPGTDTRATSVAFATCKHEPMVEAVIKSLDGREQAFLGQQPLSIRPVHYSRYRLLLDQFEATKNEMDRLIEKCDKKCTIQYSDHRANKNLKFVRIYAPFEHGQVFADLNAELWQLLHGVVLKSDNECDVWDNYFEIPSSTKALKQISTDTNALICCDLRNKQVKLYGSKDDQEEARKSVFKLLSKVHSQRHEISLPRHKLRPLVNEIYTTRLQVDVGKNKVLLDVLNSKLIVRGSADDVSKSDMIIASLESRVEPLGRVDFCQICNHAPINAITLSCHHHYCSQCLQFAIRQMGHAPFRCIFQHPNSNKQCPAHVPYVVMSDILASEEKDILHSSFLAHVRSRPDELFFCPSLDCKATYRTGEEGINLTCSLCRQEICTYCKSPAHAALGCVERNLSE